MTNFSGLVLRHARAVWFGTLAFLVLGGGAIALLLPNMSEQNAYPDLPSYQANQQIAATYGTGGYERPYLPVISLPKGSTVESPEMAAALTQAFSTLEQEGRVRVLSYFNTADERFLSTDRSTMFALLFGGAVPQGGLPGSALGEGAGLETQISSILQKHVPVGTELAVTGLDTLATGADAGGLNVPVKLALTIGAALVVLLWVFRSSLALVPLLTAFIAVPVSFVPLLAASAVIDIHETTVIMLPLFGIGIAIDYALILVARWREERARGTKGDEAVHLAMATAGHAVIFSSAAVAVGLLTMIVLPIPLLRSLGVGGTLVTITSAAVSLTVLPLLLSRRGRRLDRLGVATPARYAAPSPAWEAWGRLVVRRRVVFLIGVSAVLSALSLVGLGINLNTPTSKNLANSGAGADGLAMLSEASIPTGVLTSFDVLVPAGQDLKLVAAAISDVPGVYAVGAPDSPSWRQDGSSLLTVLPTEEGGAPAGRATIESVIAAVGDSALVGGNVTQQLDYVEVTYAAFPWMLAILGVLTLLMLTRAFGSVLLAVKAVVLNLLSLGAVLGSMVILWQWGWGTEQLLGIQPDGSIGTFIPVTIFAFLFGLSMDYEVFIISRMREEYDRTGDTPKAVIGGIARTGVLVTSAAAILFFSFASMASGGELDVAIFASGIALGILLDATLIRSMLVPAAVAVMGRWNWWTPRWARSRSSSGLPG